MLIVSELKLGKAFLLSCFILSSVYKILIYHLIFVTCMFATVVDRLRLATNGWRLLWPAMNVAS